LEGTEASSSIWNLKMALAFSISVSRKLFLLSSKDHKSKITLKQGTIKMLENIALLLGNFKFTCTKIFERLFPPSFTNFGKLHIATHSQISWVYSNH